MPLITISLPAGVYKNGTKYQAKGRWADSNLIRWHDGAIRPVGGWERRTLVNTTTAMPALTTDPATETVRDILAWSINDGNVATVFGSNSSLYAMNSGNNVTDITPAGFIGGINIPLPVSGYGLGPYGLGNYGVPKTASGASADPVVRWSLGTWGEDLIACPSGPFTLVGQLYSSQAGSGIATPIPNSPDGVVDFVVTDQRSIMAIGETGELRRVNWSDRENREDWTPQITNEAGGYTLTGSGKLLACTKVLNQVLILSETDAHVARYIGPPYVYGFDRVGEDCAPIHKSAILASDRFAMWWGNRSFWMYDGTIREIPCEVMDFLHDDLNPDAKSTVSVYQVSEYSEITWLYQSVGASDVDSYVTFNYTANHWTLGKIYRTVGFDRGPLRDVIMVDTNGYVWNHELDGVLIDGAYITSGPLELGQGDKNMAVRYVFPDTEAFGDVELTLLGKAMPTATEHTYGPYAYYNPTATRAMGREIRMHADLLTSTAEVGNMRFDVAPMGTGMR